MWDFTGLSVKPSVVFFLYTLTIFVCLQNCFDFHTFAIDANLFEDDHLDLSLFDIWYYYLG